jgi:hypothetical protein
MSFTSPAPGARVCSRIVALALSCILYSAAGSADPEERPEPQIPRNIRLDAWLTPVVASMLRDSPTFRAQCARLQDVTRVRITVTMTPRGASRERTCRAECVIRRYEYGFVDAVVRLPSTSHATELIAHELEHVLEYLEGVNYQAVSRRHSHEVWRISDGRFETARAIDAGRQVAAEMARSRSARLSRNGHVDATRP